LVGDKLFKVYGSNLREVLSVRNRRTTLNEMHSTGGHVGGMKLYHMVRSMFYWPNMIDDCMHVIEQCVHCKKLKEKPRVLPLKPTHKFDKPFQCWSIDYLPMLPESPEGYKHALLCVDPFSKWVEIFPMKSKLSSEVWTVLYT